MEPTDHNALEDQPLAGLLARAVEVEAVLREAAVEQLRVAYAWAIAHPGPTDDSSVLDAPEHLGGEGTPTVAAFTAESLSVACGTTPTAGTGLLADALDLFHRLPLVWDHTVAGLVEPWKARRIASRTRHLSQEAAGWVDRQVAAHASSLGRAQLDRVIAEAAARVDAAGLADTEDAGRTTWDVRLVAGDPATGGATAELHAIGDTLDLTRFHDIVGTEAETLGALGDTDTFETRKAKALGVIAATQARLDLTTLLVPDSGATLTEQKETRDKIYARREAKVRLHLHASLTDLLADPADCTDTAVGTGQQVATLEGHGPLTLATVKEWVGRSRVTIVPVIHLPTEDTWSVDRHDPHLAWPRRCGSPTPPARSPGAAAPHVKPTSTTSTPTKTPTPVVHPARPHQPTSHHCAGDTTGPNHPVDGDTNASTPPPTSGTDPTPLPSSPRKAPSPCPT